MTERSVPRMGNATLIYIMGTGRSGTTILEVLLSSAPKVVGAGELTYICRDAFVRGLPCSCGQLARECPFWMEVWERSGLSPADLAEGEDCNRRLEKHAAFPRVALGLTPRSQLESYERLNGRLVEGIAEAGQADFVVDSSKYAARALLLSQLLARPVKVILITRDPAGLLAAFRKPNKGEQSPKSTLAAATYYLVSLACFKFVKIRLASRVLSITYEQLIADPVSVLQKIQDWAQVDLGDAIARLQQGLPFTVSHIVTGNRLRHQKQVVFRNSLEALPRLGFFSRQLIGLLRSYRWMVGIGN